MKQAGCVGIDFGVDHGNDEMLKRLGRNFCADDLKQTAQICHKHGIIFMYDLLLGGPGETRATLKEIIDLMKKIRPSRVGVALGMRIYPGTEVGRLVCEVITTASQKTSKEAPTFMREVIPNSEFRIPFTDESKGIPIFLSRSFISLLSWAMNPLITLRV